MRQFVVRFTRDIELTYTLVDEEIVEGWTNLISSHNINECCNTNHYVGYSTSEFMQSKINRLYELADIINSHVPNKVIKQQVTLDSWEKPLQTMHVHFPELKNNTDYQHIWNELSEYNDIIHRLESTLRNAGSGNFRITLDLNKANTTFLDIPDSAYKLFTPFSNFGWLLLHYTHVGKHAHELFTTSDTVCPKDQFVPQRKYSASVRMIFTDNYHDTVQKQQHLKFRWRSFYNSRSSEFWGYDIDDPKLAFGYIKIGELTHIKISDSIVSIPKTSEELHEFRELLVETQVIDWQINGA